MLDYVLQVVVFQLGFLLMYELLLKKETFFTINRLYLLVTPLVSLLLPLLKIESLSTLVPADSISTLSQVWLPEVYIGGQPENIQQLPAVNVAQEQGLQINWWLVSYISGVVLSLILLLKKYQNLNHLFRFRRISENNELRIIEVPNSNIACTFFKTIFLGDKLSGAEKQQILSHELVHVKQKHSLDLVFFEALKILFWFNPLVYIYQSRIATLHEFIADANVVKTTTKRSYYEQLLNTAFNTQNISFINQFFNHSLIKKRIIMLQKSRSRTIAKFKYLFVLPLLFMMLTYVSCSDDNSSVASAEDDPLSQYSYTIDVSEGMTEENRKVHKKYEEFLMNNPDYVSWATIDSNEKSISYAIHSRDEEVPEGYIKLYVSDKYDMYINLPNEGKEKDSDKYAEEIEYDSESGVPFAIIEDVPVFEGCEGLNSNEERKDCMSRQITRFVNMNFNTNLGKELNLKGTNRVITQFRIDESGNVVNIKARAPHPDLEEEAIRVISELPKMQPGKQDGKEISVMYSLPIVFQIGE
ncbi:M56 family metallopeptidase [Salegentibacter salegens]|uniref:Signal transducer regulating beta-lactamase production, contains metallopeptidase domain n=1 Tax=Salegentibacter salegens TaxID=143223 RepID=A0A1M7NC59_9FLAO|nr:M56 family metallopeptidase [Salegentibacter salegens]PRX42955.1 beta-lactamase regulating signal transducer with metallopeptidase domain [Salegentibacter salegens]SHN01288.1 Signal transducer regulating beta-lactamase production, contains metallopeptidase domain [Salegentibacter salegens]